jgi:hypothetical protein
MMSMDRRSRGQFLRRGALTGGIAGAAALTFVAMLPPGHAWGTRLADPIAIPAAEERDAPIVLAQEGSGGGLIGRRDRSASPGADAKKPRAAKSKRTAKDVAKGQRVSKGVAKSKRTSKSVAVRTTGGKAAIKAAAKATPDQAPISMAGRWRLSGTCPVIGAISGYINVSGSTRFSGVLSESNMLDRGTVSNGRVNGNRVTFTMRHAADPSGGSQNWSGTVTRAGNSLVLRASARTVVGVCSGTARKI